MSKIIIILLIVVIIGVGAYFIFRPSTTQTKTPVVSNPNANSTSYTMSDVASHNTRSSCWTTINGNVYDLTTWIDQHPGGPDFIISLCGIDGTNAFTAKHGGQSRPENELSSLQIGILKK